ncbi:MAG: serine/threonine-protein kinase [Planctomycetota bacterium]
MDEDDELDDLTARTEPEIGRPRPAARRRERTQPTIPDVSITEVIGRGGQGVVFRGFQEFLERDVAVKVIDRSANPAFSDRFKQEAKLLAGLSHPNIVTCHQAGVTDEDECYMVLEYVDGEDLAEFVKSDGPLTELRAIELVADLARALQHGHRRSAKLIHRDVKPQNILLHLAEGDRSIVATKLADLGLARCLEETSELTMQGAVMGTPTTMAPEQFKAPEEVDHRTDIYGLGCVLFFAIAGVPAFRGVTVAELYRQKSSGLRGKALDELSASDGTKKLVAKMLAPEQSERPQSYDELLSSLSTLAEDLACGDRRTKRGERARRITMAGLAGVAAVAIAAFQLTRSGAEDAAPAVAPTSAAALEPAEQSTQLNVVDASAVPESFLLDPLDAGEKVDLLAPDRWPDEWSDGRAGQGTAVDTSRWRPFERTDGVDEPVASSSVLGIRDPNSRASEPESHSLWNESLASVSHALPRGEWEISGVISVQRRGSEQTLGAGVRFERFDGTFLEVPLRLTADDPAKGDLSPRTAHFPVGWYGVDGSVLGSSRDPRKLPHVPAPDRGALTDDEVRGMVYELSFADLDQILADDECTLAFRVRALEERCSVDIGGTPIELGPPSNWALDAFRSFTVFVESGHVVVRDLVVRSVD